MKTLAELNAMPDDELRVMLAEILGARWYAIHAGSSMLSFKELDAKHGWKLGKAESQSINGDVPNYPADLNACHEVVMSLPVRDDRLNAPDRLGYRVWLRSVCNHPHHTHYVDATARQRTIALILTLQKP